MSRTQCAELGQDRPVKPGHGGLAGAWRACEHQVTAHRRDGHAELGAALGQTGEVDQRTHLVLDVVQADEGVEGGQRPILAVELCVLAGGTGAGPAASPGVALAVAGAGQSVDGQPLTGPGLDESAAAVVPDGAVGHRDRFGGLDAQAVTLAIADLAGVERTTSAVGDQEPVPPLPATRSRVAVISPPPRR